MHALVQDPLPGCRFAAHGLHGAETLPLIYRASCQRIDAVKSKLRHCRTSPPNMESKKRVGSSHDEPSSPSTLHRLVLDL